MKQHITWEQLKTINSETLVPLVKDGILSQKGHHLIKDKYMAKQLTIGKMIEILHIKNQLIDITPDTIDNSWQVEIERHLFFNEKELVDALWEAVKEVLQ